MKPLALFFAFGALMAGLTALALLTPGGPLESLWSFKPEARDGFARLGTTPSVSLMAAVSVACALAAVGLWQVRTWGVRLAQGILVVNLLGDLLNATIGEDPRSWLGVPVAVALIAYLGLRGAKLAGSRKPPGGDG